MIKKITKIICLFLCICMAYTSFSGCTKKDKNAAVNQDSTSTADVKDSSSSKLVDKDYEITIMRVESANQPVNPEAPIYQEIFKRTGIKVKMQGVPTDFDVKARTLLATNDMPDVMQLKFNIAKEFVSSNVFLPLNNYIEKYAPDFKKIMNETQEIKSIMVDNELYDFPVLEKYKLQNGQVPMIREDILKTLNVSMPSSFDELYTVLKQVKQKYPDTFPWTNRSGTGNLLTCIAYPMGSGHGVYFDKDISGGKYVYGSVTQEFKQVLSYLNKLYKEGILDPNYAVNSSQQWQERLSTGKSIFYYDNASFSVNFNKALQSSNPEAKFSFMPIMKNSKGQRRNLYYAKHWLEIGYFINSKIKNPEAVVKLFNWFYTEEGADLLSLGIEGVHYTKKNDEIVIPSDLLQEYMKKSDPKRSYFADLGANLAALATYVDQRNERPFLSKDELNMYDALAKDSGMVVRKVEPVFTANELESLKELTTKVNTILDKEFDAFIMGTKPIDAFDQVAEKAKQAGALQIEKIYNDAYSRMK